MMGLSATPDPATIKNWQARGFKPTSFIDNRTDFATIIGIVVQEGIVPQFSVLQIRRGSLAATYGLPVFGIPVYPTDGCESKCCA